MTLNLKSLKEIPAFRRDSQWLLFIAMSLALSLKLIFWHNQVFFDWDIHLFYIIYSTLWLSIWVLACRHRPWWSLLIFLIVNMWLFGCYVYYKVWGLIATMDEVRALNNLNGFESSVLSDLNWSMLLWLLLPDALYVALLCWARPAPKSRWRQMLIALAAIVLMLPLHQERFFRAKYPFLIGYNRYDPGFQHWWFNHEPLFNPLAQPIHEAELTFANQAPTVWMSYYPHDYGMIDYGFTMLIFDYHYRKLEAETMGAPVVMTDEDKQLLSSLYHPENADFFPQRSLILILVESFESWAIQAKDNDGNYVMPNLRRFMDDYNTFFAPNLNPMILQGCSSDGQLMSITGLAPAAKGITATLYGDQPFPNYAHFYPQSRTLNPTPGVWNQTTVNPNYGIRILEENDTMVNDKGLFSRLCSMRFDTTSFVFLITESTHVPFITPEPVNLNLPPGMPDKSARYLTSFHYLDMQLGKFFDRFRNSPELQNCDIVIVADHSIMWTHDIEELQAFAKKNSNIPADVREAKIPLILYSPTLNGKIRYNDDCYQIDVYPTILGLIGYDNPQWKGVGINLLDTAPRQLTTDQVYTLSDKLIRSRYFSSH